MVGMARLFASLLQCLSLLCCFWRGSGVPCGSCPGFVARLSAGCKPPAEPRPHTSGARASWRDRSAFAILGCDAPTHTLCPEGASSCPAPRQQPESKEMLSSLAPGRRQFEGKGCFTRQGGHTRVACSAGRRGGVHNPLLRGLLSPGPWLLVFKYYLKDMGGVPEWLRS